MLTTSSPVSSAQCPPHTSDLLKAKQASSGLYMEGPPPPPCLLSSKVNAAGRCAKGHLVPEVDPDPSGPICAHAQLRSCFSGRACPSVTHATPCTVNKTQRHPLLSQTKHFLHEVTTSGPRLAGPLASPSTLWVQPLLWLSGDGRNSKPLWTAGNGSVCCKASWGSLSNACRLWFAS